MPAEIPEILSLAVGTNVVQSPRNLDLGLVVEFDSQGRCSNCQAELPGRFDATAARFGSRRIPVRLASV